MKYKLLLFSFFIIFTENIFSQTYVHIVTDRDNLHKLARIYGVTPLQILKINKLDPSNYYLMEHSILIIPDKNYQVDGSGGKKIKTIEYRVERNESLYTISRKFGVTVYDILLLNPHLGRGQALNEGEMLKVQTTSNSDQPYSRQIIYLNGDLIKYNLIEIKDSAEYELVKKFNATLDDRIADIYKEDTKPEEIVIDPFPAPEDKSDVMARLIYQLVKYGNNENIDKTKWLDSFYEEVFYINSEMHDNTITTDVDFLNRAMTQLYQLNLAYPKNDFLFGLRAMMYYWLGSNQKALIFTDETLKLNSENEQAQIVRAAVGQEDKHIPYAMSIFSRLNYLRPDRDVIQYNIASLCYKSQQFEKAIEYYSPLLKKAHKYTPEINFRIGHSYVLIGQNAMGCEYLKDAVKQGYSKAKIFTPRFCK